MRFVVKNTTSWSWVDVLCPHTCRGCGRLGAVLCECCKNNILKKQKDFCPLCKRGLDIDEKQHCRDCEMELDQVFVGGWREGALSQLVAEYKYQSVRAAGRVLVDIIKKAIPENYGEGETVVVVPLPTIGRHVRERGIDHTLCLAKKLAKQRGWKVERVLGRAADTVQVGVSATERQEQAKRAYEVLGKVEKEVRYLLLDDVWTTGASVMSAAKVIREAGAKKISAVVVEVGR